VAAAHFDPAGQAFGLDFAGIGNARGGGWSGTLWGCAFEDFLTWRFGPDGEIPGEAYLRRRGWKERATARHSMAALQTSVMSLYEASDILPGQSLRARSDPWRRPGPGQRAHRDPDAETLGPAGRGPAPAGRDGRSVGRPAALHAGRLAVAVRAAGGTPSPCHPPAAPDGTVAGCAGRMAGHGRRPTAGSAAVTLLGIGVANLRVPGASELRRFKAAVVAILVSALFIILIGNLDRAVLVPLS
jgi:hypothetical protein